jgi:hypothetical protein
MIVTTKTPQQLIEEAVEYLQSITKEDIDKMTVAEHREFKVLLEDLCDKVDLIGNAIVK